MLRAMRPGPCVLVVMLCARTMLAQEASADWAWQLPRAAADPVVVHADWPRNAIDRQVLAKLESAGLVPAPRADRRTLLRRLSFDLLGLPPTPQEIEAFVADDAPSAWERAVDRMLASPHYGERMARLWLDVARFGESNGFEHDQVRPNAWPYRAWLVDAFNRDLPYDAFVRAQIAGDVLGEGHDIAATGFLVAGAYDTVGQEQQSAAMRAVVRQDELEDIVSTVGQAFLGMTVHCARCHDHKFDPITQRDYYSLAAVFAGVRRGDRDTTSPAERAAYAAARADAQRRLDALGAEIEELEMPARRALAAETAQQPLPHADLSWDFALASADTTSGLATELEGTARIEGGALRLDGESAWASSGTIPFALDAKTLAVDVALDDLDQRGGAAIAVQTADGAVFDAIVFGEREPRRWMAGSDNYRRTQSFGGAEEDLATGTPLHLAMVWDADGTIRAYRNGRPYGTAYRTASVARFAAGTASVAFGLRHRPVGAGKLLGGCVLRAQLFARALDDAEIAALAARSPATVDEAQLESGLDPAARARRRDLRAAIRAATTALAAPAQHLCWAVTPREPESTHVLERGDPKRAREVVAPGGIAVLEGADFELAGDASDADRRGRFAAWLTGPSNPNFARLMVNRVWQMHFGTGLVDTPSDFGRNGGRPSHPELLDRLALDFAASGFSLKSLHRAILFSASWQQSSRDDARAREIDGDDRLLWRMAPRRLDAEAIHDAILAVSGRLDDRVGGPSFRDFEITLFGATHTYLPVDPPADVSMRRALYRTWVRGGRSAFLDAFDCPDPSTTAPRRATTTTPLQALALRNDAFVLRMAEAFSERVRRECGADPDAQVVRAFRLALLRDPDADELSRCREIAEEHGFAAVARALFNCNEFLYLD